MASDVDELKRAAARAAIAELPATGLLGLGTGSTVAHFLDALDEAIRGVRRRNPGVKP